MQKEAVSGASRKLIDRIDRARLSSMMSLWGYIYSSEYSAYLCGYQLKLGMKQVLEDIKVKGYSNKNGEQLRKKMKDDYLHCMLFTEKLETW